MIPVNEIYQKFAYFLSSYSKKHFTREGAKIILVINYFIFNNRNYKEVQVIALGILVAT